MKIIHNGLFLTRPNTGLGQYSTNLLGALAKAMPRDEHIVVVPEPIDLPPPGMTVRVLKPSWESFNRGVALDRWESHDIPRAADGYRADLYHAPYPTPSAHGRFRTVMAVHDVIPWQFPEYRKGLRTKIKLARIMSGIKSADHLTTVSQSAADDIATVALVPAERISVTYDGIGPAYRTRPSKARIASLRRKLGLKRPYILYIGGFDYRKNVRRLIRAFAESGLADSHDLVIAGSVTLPQAGLHDDFTTLNELAERAGVARQLKRPGFVDEADKPILLAGADLFVYPSLAEGFGIPVLEAVGVGTPVAASDIPPIRELFGSAVRLFDPEIVTDIAKTMRQELDAPSGSASARTTLTKRFTWEAAAARTAKVFRQVAKK